MRAKIHSEISTVGVTLLEKTNSGASPDVIYSQLVEYEVKKKKKIYSVMG
jgi:hypothetical protein